MCMYSRSENSANSSLRQLKVKRIFTRGSLFAFLCSITEDVGTLDLATGGAATIVSWSVMTNT